MRFALFGRTALRKASRARRSIGKSFCAKAREEGNGGRHSDYWASQNQCPGQGATGGLSASGIAGGSHRRTSRPWHPKDVPIMTVNRSSDPSRAADEMARQKVRTRAVAGSALALGLAASVVWWAWFRPVPLLPPAVELTGADPIVAEAVSA